MWWELPVIARCWSYLHNFSLLRGLQETCACLRGCTAAFTRNRSQSFRFMQISFCLIMLHVSILASSCMRDVFWRIELKVISLLVCPICYQQKKKKKLACGAHMYSGISVNQNCTANGIAACLVRHGHLTLLVLYMGDRKKWNLIDWKENFRYSVNRSTGKNSEGTFLKWEGIYKCILSWDVFYLLNCFSEF